MHAWESIQKTLNHIEEHISEVVLVVLFVVLCCGLCCVDRDNFHLVFAVEKTSNQVLKVLFNQ